jgi:hypothetical protein
LLVIGETSGIARAFGPGSTVHCCCGTHSSARPCPCPDCPVLGVRAHDHAVDPDQRLTSGRNCTGATADDPGILTVVALALASASLALPSLHDQLSFATPSPLHDRAVDASRPPP